jgi:excisionase family DNA binding protein
MAEIKTEYKTLREICERLERGRDFVLNLIHRKKDPLPAKKIGREWWITEVKIQEWLNS